MAFSVDSTDDETIIQYEEADRQKVFDAAERLGCEVIIAEPNELQLDIDRGWSDKVGQFKKKGAGIHWKARAIIGIKIWDSFSQEIDVVSIEGWESRHGNTHIVLTLADKYSDFERIAFQTILGSDPSRELLNWKRVVDGSNNPIALFRPKEPPKYFEDLEQEGD